MDKPQDPEATETAKTTSVPAVDLPRLVRLVVEMREALEANQVFHTPLELRKHGGEWNEYQWDAVRRTRDALVNASYVSLPNNSDH